MTNADLEKWGSWLAGALGLTNPETAGRVLAIYIPLARRLHVRTGATAEQVARRILWQTARAGGARVRAVRTLAGRQPPADG